MKGLYAIFLAAIICLSFASCKQTVNDKRQSTEEKDALQRMFDTLNEDPITYPNPLTIFYSGHSGTKTGYRLIEMEASRMVGHVTDTLKAILTLSYHDPDTHKETKTRVDYPNDHGGLLVRGNIGLKVMSFHLETDSDGKAHWLLDKGRIPHGAEARMYTYIRYFEGTERIFGPIGY